MNREEAIKMLQSGWEQTGYYTADFDANKVVDLFIKHERDTLKEFVEWLKVKYENERKAWYEIAKEKEQTEDEWEKSKSPVYFGRSYGFDRCATDLDQDLENFIKEHL